MSMSQPRESWWRRRTLRERSVLLIAALVWMGFCLFALISTWLVGNILTQQIDHQLTSTANVIATSSVNELINTGTSTSPLPTDYYVRLDEVGRPPVEWYADRMFTHAELPALTSDHFVNRGGALAEPFTVAATDDSREWRVIAGVAHNTRGEIIGNVAVALPMDSVTQSVHRLRMALVIIGGILGVLAVAVGLAVARTALRPLSYLEDTASGIAAGDLTRRVPPSDPRTEVGQLGLSFNSMLDHIESTISERDRANERLRQFASDASHELRTPLAAIRGYSELYRMGAVPDEQVPHVVSQIEASSIRMGDLVGDLLTLARLDEGQTVQVQPVDVGPIISQAVADAAVSSTEHTCVVEPDSVEDLRVMADSSWLHQVIANLLGNALHHTPEGTRVSVRADADAVSGLATIRVQDTGQGIAPEHLDRIFERFYRVDAARARSEDSSSGGGSGLGLAIVAELVRAMNGRVGVESEVGEGTTITLEFTLVTTDDE